MNLDMAKELFRVSGSDALVIARDTLGRAQIFRGDENTLDMDGPLPYRDYPGVKAPADKLQDAAILQAIRKNGNGEPIRKGDTLDYAQSKALYEIVRDHYDNASLWNTERWLASFVERNRLTYTDHDGGHYVMKGGVRKPVRGRYKEIQEEIEDEDEEDVFDPETAVSNFHLV